MGKDNKERLDEVINGKKQKGNEDERVNFKTVDSDEYEDELEESSGTGKKIVIVLIVLILSLSTIAVLWANGYEIVNFAFNKVSEINNEDEEEVIEESNNENVAVAPVDLNQLYEKVHLMVNSIIIAEDGEIWGTSEISRDGIGQLTQELKGHDDYLHGELLKWLDLDFSNGVEVHNYVWDKLGGTIGKAKELNEENVQKAIEAVRN